MGYEMEVGRHAGSVPELSQMVYIQKKFSNVKTEVNQSLSIRLMRGMSNAWFPYSVFQKK